ncbi:MULTISPECIES: FAD-dependent monooxygenase [Actinomycetes]|uniref:FAD-dependent monooxygenase n=1 Tax=Actinomycetes TaxID=1760 RepID=UPI0004BED69A|nr:MULTISPECIES: FAD-dependent monooxygenase [Actinomycetes]
MSRSVSRVLVVGGGTAGSVATLAMRRNGIDVVLAERQCAWPTLGHGITLQGNALKALEQVGVVEDILKAGYPWDHVQFRTAGGDLISDMAMPPMGGDDLPPGMGSMRFHLQRVLSTAVDASGADVRMDLCVSGIEDDSSADAVLVTFSDGSKDQFDLVVGADGIRSTVRRLIGIEAEPQSVGMSIFRMEGPRPDLMTCSQIFYGGPRYKAGFTPTSPDRMYAYIIDDDRPLSDYGPRSLPEVMSERAEGYHGLWDDIRAAMGPDTLVDYRTLEALRIDGPWHRGRVLLIGDAAHACPPMLAQGAAMATEDGAVLGELLSQDHAVETLLDLFMQRRRARAEMVVENSVQLARWELAPETPGADPAALMGHSMAVLAQPF